MSIDMRWRNKEKKNDDVEREEEAEQGSDTPRPNVSRILNHCVHYLLFTEQKNG